MEKRLEEMPRDEGCAGKIKQVLTKLPNEYGKF